MLCLCSTRALTFPAPSSLVKLPTPEPSWEACQSSDRLTDKKTFRQTECHHIRTQAQAQQKQQRDSCTTLYLFCYVQLRLIGCQLCLYSSRQKHYHNMTALLPQHSCGSYPNQAQPHPRQLPACFGRRLRARSKLQPVFSAQQRHESPPQVASDITSAITASSQQPITAVPRLQTGNEHLDGKLKIIGTLCPPLSLAQHLILACSLALQSRL